MNSILQNILFLCFALCAHTAYAQTYGLKFNGQDVTLDNRTELNLNPKGFMEFGDEFELSFDYKIRRISTSSNEGFFGYIFRIISAEDDNIDLLSTPTPSIGLNLVIGKSNEIVPVKFPSKAVNNWFKLRIKFLLNDDKLILYTPDTFYVQQNIGLKKNELVKIIFGANDYKQFNNTDVPTMVLRNIEISEKGKLKYHWPLNEVEGSIATDKIRDKKALVYNPSWIIPNHSDWVNFYKEELDKVITITHDIEEGRIFIICQSELLIYNTIVNNIQRIAYDTVALFPEDNYRAIFNSNDNHIYCYLVENAPLYKINIESGAVTTYGSLSRIRSRFQQHNSFFNAFDNSIYLFGGYGLHKYDNKIRRIDLTNQSWEELPTVDSIFKPRYLAGLGSINDTIYILGGYGSNSGNQLINPQNYFDLFGFSIKDHSLFKKFEISGLDKNMVIGNKMWFNQEDRTYYALVYDKLIFENNIALVKGKMDSPEVEFVGNDIPFKFSDIRSFAELYYMPQLNKLIASTLYNNDSTTQVAFYSIDYPPVAKKGGRALQISRNVIIGIFVLLMFFGILLIFKRIIKNHKKVERQRSTSLPDQVSEESFEPEDLKKSIERKPHQLVFFGGFQVFDKNLTDITGKFTPKIKELFLLIMLNSCNNNKGVSPEKIREILWFDKTEKSAASNRAVNIGKLRKLLKEIGSFGLTRETGYWKIEFMDTGFSSDYIDFLRLTSSKNKLTKNIINELMEIIEKGPFLFNVNYDWLDDFKAIVSDRIIDILVVFSRTCDLKNEADFIIKLTDCIFSFDALNADALNLKCRAQYFMGRHSLALATYERFFQEYLSIYGVEYDLPFLDIIELNK